jgi:hypothetical protein
MTDIRTLVGTALGDLGRGPLGYARLYGTQRGRHHAVCCGELVAYREARSEIEEARPDGSEGEKRPAEAKLT